MPLHLIVKEFVYRKDHDVYIIGYVENFEEAKNIVRDIADEYYTDNVDDYTELYDDKLVYDQGWTVMNYDYVVGYGPEIYFDYVFGVVSVDKYNKSTQKGGKISAIETNEGFDLRKYKRKYLLLKRYNQKGGGAHSISLCCSEKDKLYSR